jgi:outer membrane protein TolC
MKKLFVLAVLAILLSAPPASAQLGFVGRFLDSYQTPTVDAPVFTTTETLPVELTSLATADGVPIRINDVIGLALQSNLQLAISRYAPLNSTYGIQSARANFDPSLNLQGRVGRSSSVSGNTTEGTGAISNLSGNYSIGYSHNLLYGTSYGVNFNVSRSASNRISATRNPEWRASVQYSFSQPVLRGFGRAVNEAPIIVARNNVEQSEIQFEQQVQNTVVEAINSYWDLVASHEQIRVQEAALERAERTYQDNLIQVEIGTLAQIDVLQAEQSVASQRESVITSQASLTQREDALKTMITRTPDPGLVLLALNPVEAIRDRTEEIIPVDQAIQMALLNRPEMRQAELALQNANIQLNVARNNLLPNLNLDVSYTQQGAGGTELIRPPGDPLGEPIAVIPGGLVDAFGQVFRNDFSSYQVGFSLQIPLGNRSSQAAASQRIISQRQSESDLALTAQSIAAEVRDAYNQIRTAQARIDTTRLSRQLAITRLEAEERRNQLGASAIRFVLDEQQNLRTAELAELNSLVAYVKAVVNYDRAIGRILNRYNIEIEEQNTPSIVSVGFADEGDE